MKIIKDTFKRLDHNSPSNYFWQILKYQSVNPHNETLTKNCKKSSH